MAQRTWRRKKKLADAVNKAIDDAIERYWIATGVNTAGEIGELKKRGVARDAEITIVCGRPRFGNVRGSAPAPAKSFVESLSRRFRVFVISEYNTSQLCDVCARRLVKTRAHSVRYWRCPHMLGAKHVARDHKQRHSAEQSKDVIAARSMLIIVLTLFCTGVRPPEWTSEGSPPKPSAASTKFDDDDDDDEHEHASVLDERGASSRGNKRAKKATALAESAATSGSKRQRSVTAATTTTTTTTAMAMAIDGGIIAGDDDDNNNNESTTAKKARSSAAQTSATTLTPTPTPTPTTHTHDATSTTGASSSNATTAPPSDDGSTALGTDDDVTDIGVIIVNDCNTAILRAHLHEQVTPALCTRVVRYLLRNSHVFFFALLLCFLLARADAFDLVRLMFR